MELALALFAAFRSVDSLHAGGVLCFSLPLATLWLVERRGRNKPIDPNRQLEIHTLLDSMPDAVLILDSSGRVVDANDAAARLSGIPKQQLTGMNAHDFSKQMSVETAPNVVQFHKPIATRALAGEQVGEERRRVRHSQTGMEIDLLISANPIRDEKGDIKGALVIGRDVTELSQLQQRLADIERHQAIGHVAAGIAHDFNNTLQTISQAVAVLQMAPERPPEERALFLEMIQNAVRRGAEVIARIRDYLRSGTAPPGNMDVNAVMGEAIELTRPMWQPRPVEVQRESGACGLVRGNKADLLRMFTNLIVNSLQAMPNGGKLSLGCISEGNVVHVWVRDTGQGIPPEIRKKIFNPYFTTKAGGTGLGLSGAQKIMLELGGDISFSSEPGRTQFDLNFPKVDSVEEGKAA
jgi:PAS domain S-box-containing protein